MRPRALPTFLDGSPNFKPGDPPPTGYVQWHEWAQVQINAGIHQSQCPTCLLWRFPNEPHNH